jgi:hypothetical protein
MITIGVNRLVRVMLVVVCGVGRVVVTAVAIATTALSAVLG